MPEEYLPPPVRRWELDYEDDPEWPRQYDCCEHCEHDINDPPHEIPCPEGCPS